MVSVISSIAAKNNNDHCHIASNRQEKQIKNTEGSRMNQKLKIATFAVPLSGNKGSASMLIGLRDSFLSAEIPVSLEVFSYYPDRDATLADQDPLIAVHPGHPKHLAFQIIPALLLNKISPKLVPATLKPHIRALSESEIVLLIGGTTFADSMLFKVPWNVMAALPGYLLGKRTLFLSQTLGPIEKGINKICARWVFKRAAAIHGRGRVSAGHVRKLGINHCEYRPDLSFTMKLPNIDDVCVRHPELNNLMALITQSGKLPVGITPNSIVYDKAKRVGRDYIAFMANAIRTVNDEGYQPILIPHSYLKDSTTYHNNDRGLCLEIMKRSALKNIIFVDADFPADILRVLIGRMHILIASRFHSMISALDMGVPPITFGWGDQKYTEVLAEFGVENLFRSYRDIDKGTFKHLFKETLANRDKIVEQILKCRPNVIKDADRITNTILSYL